MKKKDLPFIDISDGFRIRRPQWKGPPKQKRGKLRNQKKRNDLYKRDDGTQMNEQEAAAVTVALGKLMESAGDEKQIRHFQRLCVGVLPEMFVILADIAHNCEDVKTRAAVARFLVEQGAGRSKESKDVIISGIEFVNDVHIDQFKAQEDVETAEIETFGDI